MRCPASEKLEIVRLVEVGACLRSERWGRRSIIIGWLFLWRAEARPDVSKCTNEVGLALPETPPASEGRDQKLSTFERRVIS